MGSRTDSFSAAVAAQQAGAGTPAAAAAAVAAAATAAAGGGEQLASFPPPASPPPPPRQGLRGRLGSPREGRSSDSPELVESLSAASLVSLASDGSFAPPLHALVDGASSQPPPDLAAMQEEAAAEAVTPRAGSQQAAAAAAVEAAAAAAAAQPSTSRDAAAAARALPRRSPLMAGTRKAAKLESLDKILGRQPVAHVRLSSAPPPPKPPSALGWLSPGKSSQQPATKRAAESAVQTKAAAAAAASAKATVAAAGVAAAGPGVPIPGAGLRRSNSDPSLSSSLTVAASLAAAAPAAAGASGLPPRPRRVTFDSAGPGLGGQPALAPTGGGLVRQSTAPTSSLDQWGSTGGLSAAGSGGLSPAPSGTYGPVQAGRLLVIESRELGSGGLPGTLRSGGTSYHTLAGLNLEGAAAAEASIKPGGAGAAGECVFLSTTWLSGGCCSRGTVDPEVCLADALFISKPCHSGPAPTAAAPLPKPPQRRLSFPNFALLRAFSRKASADGSAAAAGSVAVGRSATEPMPGGSGGMQPAPSLLGPRLPSHGSGGLGAPEPLSMSAVVYGAEAVRRGVDTLGVAAPPSACWWLTGADPLAAMMAEAQQLRAQVLRWAWLARTAKGRGFRRWLASCD